MYGCSTGRIPIQVSRITTLTKDQKIRAFRGYTEVLFILALKVRGIKYKITTDKARAIIPPSLLGTERRMA